MDSPGSGFTLLRQTLDASNIKHRHGGDQIVFLTISSFFTMVRVFQSGSHILQFSCGCQLLKYLFELVQRLHFASVVFTTFISLTWDLAALLPQPRTESAHPKTCITEDG